MRCEKLPQEIPREDCSKPELIPAQQPPNREAHYPNATGGEGRQAFGPGILLPYI